MDNPPLPDLPKLELPGSGLPFPELVMARVIFRLGKLMTGREQAAVKFSVLKNDILQLAGQCDSLSGSRRILIRRIPGLEDSSRYWSVFMTLDHLRIVNDSISDTILTLVSGRVPPRAVSTAEVKPDSLADSTVVSAFEESCCKFERATSALTSLKTDLKYAHPWFGGLDASSWHFMAGFHMNLHQKQLKCILRQLSVS